MFAQNWYRNILKSSVFPVWSSHRFAVCCLWHALGARRTAWQVLTAQRQKQQRRSPPVAVHSTRVAVNGAQR